MDYGPGRVNKKWSSLTADEKRLQARYMEIYAAMVENLDYNVGRLIRHLKEIGEYDNTLIIFHSDNGAEGWPLSASQEATNQANFASLGKSGSNVQYGLRWAEVERHPVQAAQRVHRRGRHLGPCHRATAGTDQATADPARLHPRPRRSADPARSCGDRAPDDARTAGDRR